MGLGLFLHFAGFRQCLGFGVHGLRFGVWGLGFGVWVGCGGLLAGPWVILGQVILRRLRVQDARLGGLFRV